MFFCVNNRHASRTRLALLALPQRPEMFKVPVWHSRHVFAIEDTDFKVVHLALLISRTHTRSFEAHKIQIDKVVSLDILGNFFRGTTVCSKF